MIFPLERPARGALGEGRRVAARAVVEMADGSVSSTDATIPSSPRGARSMTGSIEAHLYISHLEK